MLAVSEAGWDEGGSYLHRCNNNKTTMNDDIVVVRRLVATSLPVTWHHCGRVVVVHRGHTVCSWWWQWLTWPSLVVGGLALVPCCRRLAHVPRRPFGCHVTDSDMVPRCAE
jgi:hypothetical protein